MAGAEQLPLVSVSASLTALMLAVAGAVCVAVVLFQPLQTVLAFISAEYTIVSVSPLLARPSWPGPPLFAIVMEVAAGAVTSLTDEAVTGGPALPAASLATAL